MKSCLVNRDVFIDLSSTFISKEVQRIQRSF